MKSIFIKGEAKELLRVSQACRDELCMHDVQTVTSGLNHQWGIVPGEDLNVWLIEINSSCGRPDCHKACTNQNSS